MNLYELTRSIDPIIMDRGRDYVVNGNVLSIEEIGDMAYRAEVEGNQVYEVYVTLDRIREITLQAEQISQADRNVIFHLLLEESKQSSYNGWDDWKLALLEMASHLVLTAELRVTWDQHVSDLTDGQTRDTWSHSYLHERVTLMRYHMIRE